MAGLVLVDVTAANDTLYGNTTSFAKLFAMVSMYAIATLPSPLALAPKKDYDA